MQHFSKRPLIGTMLASIVVAVVLFTATPAAAETVIAIACGSSTAEFTTCTRNAQSWEQENRRKDRAYRIKVHPVPDDTDDRHQAYQGPYTTDTIDVYPIDIIWPVDDSENFIDLTKYSSKAAAAVQSLVSPAMPSFFDPFIIDNNTTIDKKLVALPAFADGGVLYSRLDLIRKHYQSLQHLGGCVKKMADTLTNQGYPRPHYIREKLKTFLDFVDKSQSYDKWDWTWKDLTSVAKYIQELERRCEHNTQVWGLIWQGKQSNVREGEPCSAPEWSGHSEALTCSALEWVGSKRTPQQLANPSWKIDYCPMRPSPDRQAVVAGIKMAYNWIWRDQISPLTVLSYGNQESEAMFTSGKAVFMRHWPSIWSVASTSRPDDIVVTYLPRSDFDEKSRISTLGGWEFAVSKLSKHPKEAVDLVEFLTTLEQQKRNAVTGVFRPTANELYNNESILGNIRWQLGKYNRIFDNAKKAHVVTAIRPSKKSYRQCFAKYVRWSNCFSAVVHHMLSKHPQRISIDELQRIEEKEPLCKC